MKMNMRLKRGGRRTGHSVHPWNWGEDYALSPLPIRLGWGGGDLSPKETWEKKVPEPTTPPAPSFNYSATPPHPPTTLNTDLMTWCPSWLKTASLTKDVWPLNSFSCLPDLSPWILNTGPQGTLNKDTEGWLQGIHSTHLADCMLAIWLMCCMCVCTCRCVYVCVRMCVCVCMCCMCACAHVFVCVHMCVCACGGCVCVRVCVHACAINNVLFCLFTLRWYYTHTHKKNIYYHIILTYPQDYEQSI